MVIRKIKWIALCIGMTTCFSFCTRFCFSQNIQTFVDKKDILIGEQIRYDIKATFPAGAFKVRWFNLPDSVAHFEVVDKTLIDTSSANGNTILQQTITYTSFDSGTWITPALPISFEPLTNGSAANLFTDSIPINISYSPPDSTVQLRDIKPIIAVTITDYTWYYIAGGIILLLLIIALLYRYLKKKKKLSPEIVSSKLSPYDEAMQEMNKLAQYDLQNTEEVKMYHIKLSDIFKRYLGRKENKNLSGKTTGDLLVRMAEKNISQENISVLATALRSNDAVKFAKYIPLAAESEDCRLKIKEMINLIENSTGSGGQTPNTKP